jgi:hypothetical protein
MENKLKYGTLRRDGHRFISYAKVVRKNQIVEVERWLSPKAWFNLQARRNTHKSQLNDVIQELLYLVEDYSLLGTINSNEIKRVTEKAMQVMTNYKK